MKSPLRHRQTRVFTIQSKQFPPGIDFTLPDHWAPVYRDVHCSPTTRFRSSQPRRGNSSEDHRGCQIRHRRSHHHHHHHFCATFVIPLASSSSPQNVFFRFIYSSFGTLCTPKMLHLHGLSRHLVLYSSASALFLFLVLSLTPIISPLPPYTGEYEVGILDLEVEVEKKIIHEAVLKETGQKAFEVCYISPAEKRRNLETHSSPP